MATTSAHDGSYGLSDSGSTFFYESGTTLGRVGDEVRAWVRGTGGRVYLGFDGNALGGKSFVFGPNTGVILMQDNASWGYTEFEMTTISAAASHWYLMKTTIGAGGSVTGTLYDSDGTTLLASVTHVYAGGVGIGGVTLRTFGGMDLDTIQVCPAP